MKPRSGAVSYSQSQNRENYIVVWSDKGAENYHRFNFYFSCYEIDDATALPQTKLAADVHQSQTNYIIDIDSSSSQKVDLTDIDYYSGQQLCKKTCSQRFAAGIDSYDEDSGYVAASALIYDGNERPESNKAVFVGTYEIPNYNSAQDATLVLAEGKEYFAGANDVAINLNENDLQYRQSHCATRAGIEPPTLDSTVVDTIQAKQSDQQAYDNGKDISTSVFNQASSYHDCIYNYSEQPVGDSQRIYSDFSGQHYKVSETYLSCAQPTKRTYRRRLIFLRKDKNRTIDLVVDGSDVSLFNHNETDEEDMHIYQTEWFTRAVVAKNAKSRILKVPVLAMRAQIVQARYEAYKAVRLQGDVKFGTVEALNSANKPEVEPCHTAVVSVYNASPQYVQPAIPADDEVREKVMQRLRAIYSGLGQQENTAFGTQLMPWRYSGAVDPLQCLKFAHADLRVVALAREMPALVEQPRLFRSEEVSDDIRYPAPSRHEVDEEQLIRLNHQSRKTQTLNSHQMTRFSRLVAQGYSLQQLASEFPQLSRDSVVDLFRIAIASAKFTTNNDVEYIIDLCTSRQVKARDLVKRLKLKYSNVLRELQLWLE